MMLFLFYFLLLTSCVSATAHAAGDSQPKTLELFKVNETKVTAQGGSGSRTGLPKSFYEHSLVDVNGVMVAIAVVDFGSTNGVDNSDFDIWSGVFKHGDDKGKISEAVKEDKKSEWTYQTAVAKGSGKDNYTSLCGTKVLVKESKLFFLLSNNTRPKSPQRSMEYSWDIELIEGETSGNTAEKPITWSPPKSLKSVLPKDVTTNLWSSLYVGSGRGVVTGGSGIVFPLLVVATMRDTSTVKCTVVYSDDNGSTWKFPSSPVSSADCDDSTLFIWEGKLFMITESGSHLKLYESTDQGETWREAAGRPIPHLLTGSDEVPSVISTGDVITATIENTSLLLSTSVSSIAGHSGTVIHLWFYDGSRIHNAGVISVLTVGDYFLPFCSLLYTNGELFALYDNENGGTRNVVLRHLTEQLQRIKSVLETWKEVDKRVSAPCTSATKETPCTTPMPTTGLVGFLSNGGNTTHWADEYLGVNATVTGGTKVENGFTLSGTAAQIEWRVGPVGYQQAYSFVNDGLTLVATVTVNKTPAKITPLLGVVVQLVNGNAPRGSKRYLGLWYDENKKWKTEFTDQANAATITWEEGQTYQVVLTIQNGTGSAYVDGKRVGSLEENSASKLSSAGVSSPSIQEESQGAPPRNEVSLLLFGDYTGDKEGTESNMTVKNVFLYNRQFNEAEIHTMRRNLEEAANASSTAPHKTPDTTPHVDSNSVPGNGSDVSTNVTDALPNARTKDITMHKDAPWISLFALIGLWGVTVLC